MSTYKAETSGSECVTDNLAVYAEDTIWTKLPNTLDGLKPIHRRILTCLHKDPSKRKEVALVGDVIKVHPHGDQSIASAISSMAQPFTHLIPLVYSDSSIGSYIGNEPAAARYVDVAASNIAEALFFGDLNAHMLRTKPCETGVGVEPTNLIPLLPTALMVPVFGSAVGYQTRTVACCISELCKFTKEYIKIRSKNMDWMTKIKSLNKYLLPDFPTGCYLLNPQEILKNYRAGDYSAKICLNGMMKVKSDMIVIETVPPIPTMTFKDNTDRIGMAWVKKNNWLYQTFMQTEDFSGRHQGMMKGNFKCVLRRGINPFDVLARLKKEVGFSCYWSPDRRYVDSDGVMSVETPMTLVEKWYNVRYAAVLGDLKETLKKMVDKQRMLQALVVVADHPKEVADLHIKSRDPEVVVPILSKRFNLTKFQAKFISGLTMGQLTARGRNELLGDLAKVKEAMRDLQMKFSKVPELMIETIEKFEKNFILKPYKQGSITYDFSGRQARVPKYIGTACYNRNGWIMLESEEEMDQILLDFNDPENIEFSLWDIDKPGEIIHYGDDEEVKEILPKYIKSGNIDRSPVPKSESFAVVCNDGGVLVSDGFQPRKDMFASVQQVVNEVMVVHRTGVVEKMKITDKICRKNASAGPTIRDGVGVGQAYGNECIVVHGSTSQPNLLQIERVKSGDKLHKIVVGQWKVLGVFAPDARKVVLNVPKDLRNRCVVRHIVMEDLAGSLDKLGKNHAFLLFGKNSESAKSDYTIDIARRKSTIMVARPRK